MSLPLRWLELGLFSGVISRLRAAAHALFPLAGEQKKSKVEALRHSTHSVAMPSSRATAALLTGAAARSAEPAVA